MDNTTVISILLVLILLLVLYTNKILKTVNHQAFVIPHEIFESVISHIEYSIVIIQDNKILFANKIFEETTGLRYDEIRGFDVEVLAKFNYPTNINHSFSDFKINYVNNKGIIVNENLSMINRKLNNQDFYILVGHDMSKLAHREKHLIELANHDPLTNLLNKSFISEHMSNLIKNKDSNERALLFLDLDNFKSINDKLGHIFGDKIIIEMSKRVSNLLRDEDLIARIYGDEFAVLLRRNNKADVEAVVQNIINEVSECYNIDGISIKCSCSIGVFFFKPSEEISPESLIEKADNAMYKAKSMGKNTYSIFSNKKV